MGNAVPGCFLLDLRSCTRPLLQDLDRVRPLTSAARDPDRAEPLTSAARDPDRAEPLTLAARDLDRVRPLTSAARDLDRVRPCLLYTSPSPRDRTRSRMPSSA